MGVSSPLSQSQALAFTSNTTTSEALAVAPENGTGASTTAVASPVRGGNVTVERSSSTSMRSPSTHAHGSLVAANSVASPATAAVTAAASANASATPPAVVQTLGEVGGPSGNRLLNSPHPTASLPKHASTLGSSFSSPASPSSSSMAPPPPRSPLESPARSSLRSPSRSFLQSPVHQAPSAQCNCPARGAATLTVSSPPPLPVRGFCQSPLAATTAAAAALASAVDVTNNTTNSALVLPQARSDEVAMVEEQNDAVPLRERIEAVLHAWALDHNSSDSSSRNDGISWSTEEQISVDFRQSAMGESREFNLNRSPVTTAVVDLITAAAVDIMTIRQRLRNARFEASTNTGANPASVSGDELSSDELQRLVCLYTNLLGCS